MKKLRVLAVAGVLSLAIGTSVFAADFSGGGRIIRHHMNPAACVTAMHCTIGNGNLICGNWAEYCRNYVETANNSVNDTYAAVADTVVSDSYTEVSNDAGNDSYTPSVAVYDDYGYGGYVDADNDGVCDNWQNGGYGGNYVDADNNGVCDNWQNGGGYGNGNGYCGGYGNGGGYGGGHHGGGHGRGCNW